MAVSKRRHMVSDKSQVRSTGPVNAITRQPVKGRKKHGGIRLGEMERDALLSHGVAFCLQDRLMNCSDSHLAHVCAQCGSLISVYAQPLEQQSAGVDCTTLGRFGSSFAGTYSTYMRPHVSSYDRYSVLDRAEGTLAQDLAPSLS